MFASRGEGTERETKPRTLQMTKHEILAHIASDVSKIANSVDGQLNGVGYNINVIKKLLKKGLGVDVEDDKHQQRDVAHARDGFEQ
jgi:phage-related protein